MDAGNINIIEKNGSNISAEGISYLKVTATGKEYLFYTLNETVENGLTKMYIAEVAPEGLTAGPIEDAEWDNLKKIMLSISHGEEINGIEYLSMKDKTFTIGDAKKLAVKADKRQAFVEKHNQSVSGALQAAPAEEPAFVSPEETPAPQAEVSAPDAFNAAPVEAAPVPVAPPVEVSPVQAVENPVVDTPPVETVAATPVIDTTQVVETAPVESAPVNVTPVENPVVTAAPVTTISIEEALKAADTITQFLNELVNTKDEEKENNILDAQVEATPVIDTTNLEVAPTPEMPTDSLVAESDLSSIAIPTVEAVNINPLPTVEAVVDNTLPPIPESTTVRVDSTPTVEVAAPVAEVVEAAPVVETPAIEAPQMIDMTQLTQAPVEAPVVDTPLIETPPMDMTPEVVTTEVVAPAVPPMDSVAAEMNASAIPDVTPTPIDVAPVVEASPTPQVEAPPVSPELPAVPTMETPSIGSDIPVQMPDGMVGNTAPNFDGGILSPTTYDANNPSLTKAA